MATNCQRNYTCNGAEFGIEIPDKETVKLNKSYNNGWTENQLINGRNWAAQVYRGGFSFFVVNSPDTHLVLRRVSQTVRSDEEQQPQKRPEEGWRLSICANKMPHTTG